MSSAFRHDRAMLDAMEALGGNAFHGTVWRITRLEREALRGSSAHGRWSGGDGAEVLYTSMERRGALAEIGFRLAAEPIWPSRMRHAIHAIEARAQNLLDIGSLETLRKLGVDVPQYESFDYSKTQAISAAAHFLEFDGLILPSARADCRNIVFFLERHPELQVTSTIEVNWELWRRERQAKR